MSTTAYRVLPLIDDPTTPSGFTPSRPASASAYADPATPATGYTPAPATGYTTPTGFTPTAPTPLFATYDPSTAPLQDPPRGGQTGAVPPAPKTSRRARFGRDYLYLLLCCCTSLAVFIIVVVLLSLGFGLMVLWVGFPILLAAFGVAYGYAGLQRNALEAIGEPVETLPRPPKQKKGFFRYFAAHMTSAERWREVALATFGSITQFIIAMVGVCWIGGAVTEILSAFTLWANGLVENLGLGLIPAHSLVSRVADIVLGLALAAVWPAVVWVCAKANRELSRFFLKPSRQAMERRLAQVAEARNASSEAESQSLRQIERDLHDGPQQSLIRTGMDLAAARRRLAQGDTAAAEALLAEAQDRTNATIQDIRSLARGFAPPILAERGLATALASLAGGSPIPARLSLGDGSSARYPEPVERALYFTAAEAVANAAKYSGASRLDLTLDKVTSGATSHLILTVTDNGLGGVVPLPGHGLEGLRSRLAGVEGSLTVQSPAGDGTRLTAVVPVA